MQVAERSQNSIVRSLSELRDIEQQRIAEEVAALQRADAERLAARETAERRAREEEEARVRAEREARLAAEQARLAVEQAERMRIDAAAAAELARQQVALEQTRLDREHALRREQVARTRPTWMIAVTVLATAAAGVMVWLTLSSRAIAEDARGEARLALLDRDQARQDAREARDTLVGMQRELDEHARTIRSVLTQIKDADTRAEREVIAKRIQREQDRAAVIEAARKKAAEDEVKRIRGIPVVIPKECEQNPFAPGCGK
jgi:hypothetical protein